MSGKDADTVNRTAKRLHELTDDQDGHELAAYANGDDSRLGFFNANTYLQPLEEASGEIVLETEATGDTHGVDGTYFYVTEEDGLTARVSHRMEPEHGVDAVARFSHAYDDDGMELVPKHVEETPLSEVPL